MESSESRGAPGPATPPLAEFSLARRRVSRVTYILFTALLLRVVALTTLPPTNVWTSAAEMANVAKSVAAGQGFSSPFARTTGPTAWVPPVYPLLLAGIFKLFGVFSRTSALVSFLFQIGVSSLTCIPIVGLAEELGSPGVGEWAGWLWAVYPYFVLVPVLFLWETTLSAFFCSWLLLLTARLRHSHGLSRWAVYGALWGLAGLTSTALLTLLPVCFGWLWWKKPQPGARWLVGPALTVVVLLLLIAPWCWRNWKVFHGFVPLRSNFGEELWLGNHEGGRGRIHYGDNAYENPRELQRFQEVGEIAYVRAKRQAALDYIASHPQAFLRNLVYRLLYWWFGVGEHATIFWLYAALGLASLAGLALIFWRGAGGWYLIAFSTLLFPVTYYVSDVIARYRHPIEPAMTLVSAYFLYWAGAKAGWRFRQGS